MEEELKVYAISIYTPTQTYRVAAPDERTARHAAMYKFMDQEDQPEITSCYEEADREHIDIVVDEADGEDEGEW